jgi:hypothetical protein
LLTNLDADSPTLCRTEAADITDVTRWPSHLTGSPVRAASRSIHSWGWAALAAQLQEASCAS